jgi:N-acetyl-gamma-glutamyl-phosphate reductase
MLINKKINVVIIGASGYTGVELLRLLLSHPDVVIKALVADSNAGQAIENIYPHLQFANLPDIVKLSEVDLNQIDVVFCCLPHATSQEVILQLPKSLKIIDLSADFRLTDESIYEKWYQNKHIALDIQKEAVYGLSEIYRNQIRNARVVACPGCYPTSVSLPLVPLIKNNLIHTDDIIIDSKTGVTGAGRATKQAFLYSEINESVKAYNISNHRHMPEIEQTLSDACGKEITINFTPHLIPMSRGILSTIYVKLIKSSTVDTIRNSLREFYKNEQFVHVLENNKLPSTKDVYNTNMCVISAVEVKNDRVTIISVIDNLTKGSSGQAVQNMNIMFGIDEAAGLKFNSVFP